VKKWTISRKDAKAQRIAKDNCFVSFAPLREMLLLFQGFFHSFASHGKIGPTTPREPR